MAADPLPSLFAAVADPEYLLTSLIVVAMPGTGVLYTLAFGLGQGARASIVAALGCTLGIVPHLVASVIGLAAVLHSSAVAFQAVKLLGVAYLLYMASSMARHGGALTVSAEGERRPAVRIAVNGLLLNLLNPKLSLFFLAFLPLFVPAETAAPVETMLVLGAVFMILTFVVFVGYGICASAARAYVIERPSVMRGLRYGFAGAFCLLGLRLLASER